MLGLRPCPWCGKPVNLRYQSEDNMFVLWHKDAGCPFVEPFYMDGDFVHSLSEARDLWNSRASKKAKPIPHLEIFDCPSPTTVWLCGTCHTRLPFEAKYCPKCGTEVE